MSREIAGFTRVPCQMLRVVQGTGHCVARRALARIALEQAQIWMFRRRAGMELSLTSEDRLIHFSHGRKLPRDEIADPVHAAKQIREYLDGLKQLGIADVHALYRELCSISHPSAESVVIWFDAVKESDAVSWSRTGAEQRERIDQFLDRWRGTNEGVFNAAFVPVFMSLRILHKLNFLPKIASLKSFPLESFPAWERIERQMRK
jgi:hypothetical protein